MTAQLAPSRRPAAGSAPRPRPPDKLTALEPAVAALILFALGFRQDLHTEITSGYLLAFLAMPLWVRHLRAYRGARLFMSLGLLATVWGIILPKLAGTHVVISSQRNNTLMLVLGTLAGIGVVLWARRLMPPSRIMIFFGCGWLAGSAAGFTAASNNPWKFVWAVPVAITLLGLAARTGRRRYEVLALGLLMLVSGAFDSRSYLATFALTAMLVVWQRRPTNVSDRVSWVLHAGLGALLAAGVYYLGTTLLVSGYLGRDAQERSIAQIDQAGSLILGGRPELSATFALFKHDIWGFGAGTLANPQDVLAAKTGMFNIGYAPNNGYVDRFMFGGNIELHSMFGDLWAWFGWFGVLFTVAIAFYVVRGLASALAHRTASAGLLFICIWTLWNVAFSPFYASEPTLLLTMGLAFLPEVTRRHAPAVPAFRRRFPSRV